MAQQNNSSINTGDVTFTLNGSEHTFSGDLSTPLLWVLREQVGLQGTKFGCGAGLCGACTVHLNGAATRSCVLPIAAVAGQQVISIEGLSDNLDHPVQKAWLELDVPQCGYCQSGMIMAAAALLEKKPDATDADIDRNITNICRCGTYQRVRQAIHIAKDADEGGES